MESWWGRDFPHPSGAALGPIQSPMEWEPGVVSAVWGTLQCVPTLADTGVDIAERKH